MRPSARQRGYTGRWEKAAATFKQRHPYCIGCLALGRKEPSTLVDHIEPHKGDQAKFWDTQNWQASCGWHHNAVKPKLERLWFNRAIDLQSLKLDSPKAISVAKDTPRRQAIGADGWPV